MLKQSIFGLLVAASVGATQPAPPAVRPVLARAQAQGLSRDPSAVLADPAAIAALAAFVAPLQQHAPRASDGGTIGAFFAALPPTLMLPVEVSGTLLWVSIATDLPEDALPAGLEGGSELAADRYLVQGTASAPADAQAVCPMNVTGYRVWTIAGVGPIEGCVAPGE